jgi:membrane protein DedA with SNARE-associated domain
VQKAAAKPTFAKAIGLIERFPSGFILGFRFLYGLRAAGPVAIGVTQVGKTHFAVLNAIGAMIWSGVFVGLGYVCGPAVMTVLQGVAAHAGPVIAAAVVAGVVGGLAIWAARERLSP